VRQHLDDEASGVSPEAHKAPYPLPGQHALQRCPIDLPVRRKWRVANDRPLATGVLLTSSLDQTVRERDTAIGHRIEARQSQVLTVDPQALAHVQMDDLRRCTVGLVAG